ncbi:MAG: uroporphyrinogen decarboxylase family protein [Bacteroidales bacterium]|jgi:uroporphyrinogen decarboxylase|nr:uroporphyrinogen decarboxylase family protein [Bacteroidales bacterium]
MTKLTPYDRLKAVLDGENTKNLDRAPNLNILMFFAAYYINAPFGKFCTDYKTLVEGNLRCVEKFDIDVLSTMSDPVRETADFGTELDIPEDELPHPKRVLLPNIEDVQNLQLFDPLKSVRILDRIKAIELFKKERGDEYPILGWVEGPLAEASDLRGINDALIDVIDEDNEELFYELLEKCTQEAIWCAKAQVEAGAHIIGVGDAACSLINRDLYREKIVPYEKRIVEGIKQAGGIARLHICGNINHILEDIATVGFDIVDIDWMVDMKHAVEVMQGTGAVINGNIDPVAVVLNGSVSDVKNAVYKCRKEANGRAIISAGCEIPKFTKHENLLAFAEALYEQI